MNKTPLALALLCMLLASSCSTTEQEDPQTLLSHQFIDPAFKEYITQVIGYAYYNHELPSAELTLANVSTIVTINLARNYPGAPLVSSLSGIEYLIGAQILDLREQYTLKGEYDLRPLTHLYYLRIEGATHATFIVSPAQAAVLWGDSGVFDGNRAQVMIQETAP